VDSYSDFVKRILSGMADLLSMAERAAANGRNVDTGEFASLFPEITAFTERLRFNVLYKGPQKFACTEIPLAEVKAIRQECGASVNDVILAIVTATIRRYCELHGDPVKGKLLRIMVPVICAAMAVRRNWATAFRSSRSPFRWISGHRSSCWPLSINEPSFSNACMPPSWSVWRED